MPDFSEALRQLKRWTGITLDPSKTDMIEQRLRRCVGETKREAVLDFLAQAEHSPEARQRFINAMTTNETYFFRTDRVWRHFRKFLPEWHQAHPRRRLEVWSGASSTGEEPYSIALTCAEFARLNPSFQFQVTATDIDTNVLETARQGVYTGRSAESLWRAQPELARRYGGEVNPSRIELSQAVKSRVEFRQHNLMHAWPGGGPWADIVFLRNVLIYFEPTEQTRILEHVRAGMRPGGTIILGESESLMNLQVQLAYRSPQIYERQTEAACQK